MQQDVSNGAERVRAWPRSRGKAKTKEQADSQEKFRQIQKAMPYVAPNFYQTMVDGTRNSPLLPRDVFTMIMNARMYAFILPDGRTLWPVAGRTDVSESLDVLGNAQQGDTLVRGPDFWEVTSASGGGGGFNFHYMKLTLADVGFSSGFREIPVDTAVADPAGWCDTSANAFVPDQAGWYLIVGHHFTNGSDCLSLYASRNGVQEQFCSTFTGSSENALLGVAFMYTDGSGDELGMMCNMSSGGSFLATLEANYLAIIGPIGS